MTGTSEDVTVRMKKNVISWFGHVERKSDERMARKIYNGNVSGKRGRGRPQVTFENSIEDTRGRSRTKHEDPPENIKKITFQQ